MATFLETIISPQLGRKHQTIDHFLINVHQAALKWDSGQSSTTLINQSDKRNELNAMEGQYKKGACLVRMIYHLLGAEQFQSTLRAFLSKYQGKAANVMHWLSSLNEIAHGQGVNNATLRLWFEQPNYPLVILSREYGDGRASLQQIPFTTVQSVDFFYRQWNVPVWYQIGTEPAEHKVWLKSGADVKIDTPRAPYNFLMATKESKGFYRLQYDEANWQLMEMQLKAQHELIDKSARMQIIDDAFSLAKEGKLSYHLALDLVNYLPQENEMGAWQTAIGHIDYLYAMLISTPNYDEIKRFCLYAYEAAYHRLGWQMTNANDRTNEQLRALIWNQACKYNLPHCVQTAINLFVQYRRSCEVAKSSADCNIIPTALRATVYCVAISQADSTNDWSFLWKKYTIEEDVYEREALIRGLCCTGNIKLLNDLLDMTIGDKEIKLSWAPAIFKWISENRIGAGMIWDYATKRWSQILQRFNNSHALERIVQYSTDNFKTVKTFQVLQLFIESTNDLGTASGAFGRQLDAIRLKIFWMEDRAKDVVGWIKNNLPETVGR